MLMKSRLALNEFIEGEEKFITTITCGVDIVTVLKNICLESSSVFDVKAKFI